jgi:hypothetical protein
MISVKTIAAAAVLQAVVMSPAFAVGDDDQVEVVVTAPRDGARNQVRGFVRALTGPGRYAALPRWSKVVCPGVVGMDATHARALNDRIGRVALDLGLRVGEPGCSANVVIYFVPDGDAAAATLAGRHGPVSSLTGTRQAVRDFVEQARAVRWWYATSRSVDGFAIRRDGDPSGIRPSQPDGAAPVYSNAVRVRDASRLRSNTQENFAGVLIVVDAHRTANLRFRALADYIAMISLAQINPNADTSDAPSILNLFTEAAGPKSDTLTEWDSAYLRGLYAAPEDTRDSRQQEARIVGNMIRSERQ